MASIEEQCAELLHFVTNQLVDEPEQVVIQVEQQGEKNYLVHLEVAPGDLGLVIGKSGRSVSALRTLLFMLAEKHGASVRLNLVGEKRKGSQPGE